MTSNMQIRMNAGVIDEGAGHVGTHAAEIEAKRAELKAEAARALANLDGGAGGAQHEAVMRRIDTMIDDHLAALRQHGTGLSNAADTAGHASRRMIADLGNAAV
jgi:uncharacterized protein YukE